MLDFIRAHQRLALAVLIILILPSFVLLGVSGYTNLVSDQSELVKVGKTTITEQEFDHLLRNQFDRMQSQFSEDFDPALLDQPNVRRDLLDRLIQRQLLVELAQNEHFSASDNALRLYIASLPELQENGTFSAERYEEVLRTVGMDPQGFEQTQRAELALERVTEPILESIILPEKIKNLIVHAMVDGREVQRSFFPLTDDLLAQEVSDDELTNWYETHKEEYELPEYVNVEYVILNEEAARSSVPTPSDEELKQYYEQNKKRFQSTAQARIAHIFINEINNHDEQELRAHAEEIANEAQQSPNQFDKLAVEHSQDKGSAKQGGDLGWLTEGSLPGPLNEAAFALGKGDVSGVIEGDGGYHILKIIDTKPKQTKPLSEVREQILAEITEQLAADQFAQMATNLTELIYEHPDSLEPAAQALGLELKQAKGLAREGVLETPIFGENAAYQTEDAAVLEDPQVRRALFDRQTLAALENSGVIEIAPDLLIAARATELVPAHIPNLEQVKMLVEKALRKDKAMQALNKLVETQMEKLNKGEEIKQPFESAKVVSRSEPQNLDRQAIDTLLAVPTNHLPQYVQLQEADGYAIYKINQVKQSQLGEQDKMFLMAQIDNIWRDTEEMALMSALADYVGVEELPAVDKVIYEGEGDF